MKAEIIVGVVSGFGSSIGTTVILKLLFRSIFQQIKDLGEEVEKIKESKMDQARCAERHAEIQKNLARGEDNFKEFTKTNSKTQEVLGRIDERLDIFTKIFDKFIITIRPPN